MNVFILWYYRSFGVNLHLNTNVTKPIVCLRPIAPAQNCYLCVEIIFIAPQTLLSLYLTTRLIMSKGYLLGYLTLNNYILNLLRSLCIEFSVFKLAEYHWDLPKYSLILTNTI